MKDVRGKVAFITGGGSGVGLGMAKVFTDAGMKVVIADVRQDHLDAATRELAGREIHAIKLDVSDRAAMEQAAVESERVFGNVHVVCNNAGINLFNDIGDAKYADWDWVLGVNLGGVINGVQTFVPRIKAHGEGGHIVNTASMAAFLAGPGAGIYTCSKFAVRGLSESVLCPGLVKSAIHESERIRPQNLQGTATSPEFLARLADIHEFGMSGEEVAGKVLQGIQRNALYIFSHSEFKDELREIFDGILAALPDDPVDPRRLEFEQMRRQRNREAAQRADRNT
jgi:NADP-dependent 3-hydroxy acid dehydrogenase YdfG